LNEHFCGLKTEYPEYVSCFGMNNRWTRRRYAASIVLEGLKNWSYQPFSHPCW